MIKENAVTLNPEHVKMCSTLLRANAILIEAARRKRIHQPTFESLVVNDSKTGEDIVEIDKDFLKILAGATLGLYNEIAHPLQQVLKDGRIVLETSRDEQTINRIKKELEIIQDPDNPIDYHTAFNP